MSSRTKKILDKVEYTLTFLMGTLLLISVLVIGYQVFMRYVLNYSPSWTEELARFFNVAITLFGSALAVRGNSHISLDFISSIISEKMNKYLDVVNSALQISFFVIFSYASYIYLMQSGTQKSPGLGVDMYIPYTFVFISAIVGVIYSVELFLKCLTNNTSTESNIVLEE